MGMIRITVNGEGRDIPEGATLLNLLDLAGINRGRVACEVNGAVVRRADHGNTPIKDGDVIEIVQMIGGG